ncbi:MAG: DUF4115 domain-containing protein [Bacteroidetes bacterium]|nr:DUF4115 domain-containing protein [Bacteroidota bacterium]
MPTESIKKLADEFKSHREKKEISLQLIHNRTRIDIKYLRAIEEGNFDVMPQVYLRAFIKEYAKSIELDPAETIKKYEMAIAGNYGIETTRDEEGEKSKKEIKSEIKKLIYTSENLKGPEDSVPQKNNNLLIGIVAVASVIILALVIYIISNNSEPEILKENQYQDVLEESKERFEAPSEEIVPAEKVDSISLKITTVDTSWIRILVDGKDEQEYILKPQREKDFKAAREFKLLTGNAGGLVLILNGKKLDFDNPPGAIRNYLINRKGIQTLESSPVKSK